MLSAIGIPTGPSAQHVAARWTIGACRCIYGWPGINHLGELLKLPPEAQGHVAREVLKNTFLADFELYCKYALGFKDINPHTHGEAIETLEQHGDRKIIVLPRGTFKSTLCDVAYPMWRLEKDPDLTILLDSELYTNSANFIREVKGHYMSSRYISIFGERAGSKWGEAEINVSHRTNSQRGLRKEASITAGGVGTTKVGQHYDLIIGDDYNSPKNSDTPEKCQKVIDHVRYNLNILNPGGEYVFVGTRYAERDVVGWLLKDILNEKHLADGKMLLNTETSKDGEI